MNYFGEHLLPGQLGQFFIVLSLVASIVATFSYFKSTRSANDQDAGYWKKLARYAFIAETISVIAIFSILFYIIHNHLFEYKYAWQHSSLSLEFKYMLACFWEGQEGSFLLWSFWHCMLGLVLIKTGKQWEAPVMTVISFAQVCLATMIAGLYIFNWKMGTNPFILLRDSGVLDNAPALHVNFDVNQPLKPDYMSSIKDGNDLNPLLQNYWMVIHPPVLFLGFASTIVPFAFAISGLWLRKFGEWTKQALPWALFSTALLGVGIMMGAAWAYESLTFGGYWAWDPVENASLVPWLILVAALHTLLIYKHSGHSLRSSFLFFILVFGFILYSTFLTRSGILGDSSVHAFTDLGMNWQLLAFLLIFVLPAFILYFNRYKEIPTIKKEESASSREFWMFIGSLVFFLSAVVIIGKTSVPVLNKIFHTKLAAPEDPEFAYNQIQIFVAIIVAVLTGFSQYLKYKSTPTKIFWKKIFIPTLIAVAFATIVVALGKINYDKKGPMYLGAIWLAVACSIYAIIANLAYIWIGLKGKLGVAGGSVAHFGFGLVLLGILLSSSKKEILSYNQGMPVDFGTGSTEKPGENLTLIKGLSMPMGKFDVTYISDSAHPKKEQWYYKIHFKSRTDDEEFTLHPNAFVNYKGNEGMMANPDSRHYWDHDVFTYISALPNPDKNKDTASFKPHTVEAGDTVSYLNGYMTLDRVVSNPSDNKYHFTSTDTALMADITVFSKQGPKYHLRPVFYIRNNAPEYIMDTAISQNLVVAFTEISSDKKIVLQVKESDAVMKYVTLKAYKFPFINVLWVGIIVTAIGVIMSMIRRIRLNRKGKAEA